MSVSCLGRPCLSEGDHWFSPVFSLNNFIICVLYLDLCSFTLFLCVAGGVEGYGSSFIVLIG